jgi:UDP-N-acetylmuramoylalanine--D-glutamate ligase
MNGMLQNKPYDVVIGFGKTGESIVAYLRQKKCTVVVLDERPLTPLAKKNLPNDVTCYTETWPDSLLAEAERIFFSPGVPIHKAAWAQWAKQHNAGNDLTLFAQCAQKPILAVTGSNGKSTVVSMMHHISKTLGFRPHLAGNIGTPMLDLWTQEKDDADYDHHILELSSFQLALNPAFASHTALVLNLWPNHLDWHPSHKDYSNSKLNLYTETQHAVVPQCIATLKPKYNKNRSLLSLDANPSTTAHFYLKPDAQGVQLMHQNTPLMHSQTLPTLGKHNAMNALAALAVGHSMGWPLSDMATALTTFQPLPHRLQPLGKHHNLNWINDAKATNERAVITALEALPDRRIWLLIGGIKKPGDTFDLIKKQHLKNVAGLMCFGQDRAYFLNHFKDVRPCFDCNSLQHAIACAQQTAQANETVLLSPGCASFDAFQNFEARGNAFIQEVMQT